MADNSVNNENDIRCPLETKFAIEFINVPCLEENCDKEKEVNKELINDENLIDVLCTDKTIKRENVENNGSNPLGDEREIENDHVNNDGVNKNADDRIDTEKIEIDSNKVFLKESGEKKCKEKKFRCTYPGCKIKFAKPSKLKRHLCMHTGERPFVCNFKDCDKAYTNNSYLRRHKLTHSGIKETFLCKYCKAPFTTQHNLKRHCSRIHENPLGHERKCDECHIVCLTRKLLSKHMKKIHKRNLYLCSFCPKSFSEPWLLQRHLNTNMHKIFICKICQSSFDKHSDFREHRKEHIVVYKEFSCDICKSKFNHKGNLRLHLKGHESSSIFVCSYVGCNRVYSFQRNLDTHIVSFHLGKKWECHLCPMKLSSKQKLNGHIEKIHINPVPRKPQPTKENRKRRWDVGIPRKSAITKICGLILPNETEKLIIYRDIKCDQP